MKQILTLLILLLSFPSAFSQERQAPTGLSEIAEELAADENEPEAVTSFLDRLYELEENPVNINSGDENELSRLFFLTDFQVKVLLDYTRTSGNILSFNEIPLIPGFGKASADLLRPFIILEPVSHEAETRHGIKQKLVTGLSVKPETFDSSSCGSPWKIQTRYRFIAGNLSGGFTTEKDPGERFFTPGTLYPDFFSANVGYFGDGTIKKIIIGDFSARFGQGTNINPGSATGVSLTTQGYVSASNEIKPYTSADENNFFRGVALVLAHRKTSFSLFWSGNRIDATTDSTEGVSGAHVTSLYRGGIHNTPLLLSKKDAVFENVFAINAVYNLRNAKAGLTYSRDVFSFPFMPDRSDPSRLISFTGSVNTLYSAWYNIMINNILFYGEGSAGSGGHTAFIQGLSLRPSGRLAVNLLCRRYGPGYTSFHGNGPGGWNGTNPESTLLGSFTFEAAKHLFISGACMLRKYLWLKYSISSPASSIRRELRVRYLPDPRISLEWMYSLAGSMDDDPSETKIPGLADKYSGRTRLSLKYQVADNLTLGTRIDYTRCRPAASRGFLMLQDLNYRFIKVQLDLHLRYSAFSTDDWDSRIYAWENDLLYTFSVPSFSGKGSRFYMMAVWKINEKADLRIKYGFLTRNPGTTGDTDINEFKIQLRLLTW
jgi:hypothetical protein